MAVHLPPFELDGFTAYITLFGCKTGCNLNFFGLEIISGSKPIPCIPCEVITSSIYLMFHPYCLRNQKTSNAGKIKKEEKRNYPQRVGVVVGRGGVVREEWDGESKRAGPRPLK